MITKWPLWWKVLATIGTVIVGIAGIISAYYAFLSYHNPPIIPHEMPKTPPPQISNTYTKEMHIEERKPLQPPDVVGQSYKTTKQQNAKSESNLTSSIDRTMSDYYTDVISLEANDSGSIIIRGHTELYKLVQFCPDEWVDGCSPNIEIKRKGDVFNLNKNALARHQSAFNFQDANGLWLQIKSNNVYVGNNLVVNKGANGSYFVYSRRATN